VDGITLTVLVPAQLDMMMAHRRWASADFSHLRMITTGSTIVPRHVIQAVHAKGVPLVQVYGSTETCPIAVYLKAGRRHAQTWLHRPRRRHCRCAWSTARAMTSSPARPAKSWSRATTS
jgi:fatty-acyl-CoA synthase